MAGLTPAILVARYPKLFHVAAHGSWESIQRYGLLSTTRLLEHFEVERALSSQLLTKQRKTSVSIAHPTHGRAVLRDQKVLSESKLAKCLYGCDVPTWLKFLNDRVFFWLDEERLEGFLGAAEYQGKVQTLLHLEIGSLLKDYGPNVLLSHMNTGNTRPFAHPRGLETFKTVADYPYETRRRLKNYSAIVEFTVFGGVPNVADYVTRVEHVGASEGKRRVLEVIFER